MTVSGPIAAVLLAITVMAGALFAQEPAQPALVTGQAAAPAIPSYPNSTKGLEEFVKDTMNLVKSGDMKAVGPYTRSLAVPDPHSWYKSVFGEYVGLQLAEAAEASRSNIEGGAESTLSMVLNQKMTDIHVVRFTDSCNDLATAKEYPILALREHPEPFFDVRFQSNPSTGAAWGFFAYVDGGFRYIGDIQKGLPPQLASHPTASSTAPPGVKVPGNVQAAKLIHFESPVYPVVQNAHHRPGTVILSAVVAKDGSIQDLNLIEGECAFAKSALESVKKWRYTPTLLNGEPVEVNTTITVVYKPGR